MQGLLNQAGGEEQAPVQEAMPAEETGGDEFQIRRFSALLPMLVIVCTAPTRYPEKRSLSSWASQIRLYHADDCWSCVHAGRSSRYRN